MNFNSILKKLISFETTKMRMDDIITKINITEEKSE